MASEGRKILTVNSPSSVVRSYIGLSNSPYDQDYWLDSNVSLTLRA